MPRSQRGSKENTITLGGERPYMFLLCVHTLPVYTGVHFIYMLTLNYIITSLDVCQYNFTLAI